MLTLSVKQGCCLAHCAKPATAAVQRACTAGHARRLSPLQLQQHQHMLHMLLLLAHACSTEGFRNNHLQPVLVSGAYVCNPAAGEDINNRSQAGLGIVHACMQVDVNE